MFFYNLLLQCYLFCESCTFSFKKKCPIRILRKLFFFSRKNQNISQISEMALNDSKFSCDLRAICVGKTYQEHLPLHALTGRSGVRSPPARAKRGGNLSQPSKKAEKIEKFEKQMITLVSSAKSLYEQMLSQGVAKECARMVLPLCTPTRIYMTGSCRSWVHYINLRSAHGTQKEHMQIAEECRKIFIEQFPNVSEALEWV